MHGDTRLHKEKKTTFICWAPGLYFTLQTENTVSYIIFGLSNTHGKERKTWKNNGKNICGQERENEN